MRLFWVTVLVFACTLASGQGNDQAEKIYKASQGSVFLVYLNDSSGNPDALGSAFLVAPGLLVTNAHVAEAGSPVLAIGPVRVPLKIVRIDQKNDLAILSIDLPLTSKPLSLSLKKPSPGEQVFALGNPEGLEKTISQGIVSGIRTLDGRQLIQITSPISHGSSGSPILDANGEVIGVAVGMLTNGQNLNFAVPAKYIRALLDEKASSARAPMDCSQAIADLNALVSKRGNEQYSSDASSQYQQDTAAIKSKADAILDGCRQPPVLKQVACWGADSTVSGDDGIKAARLLVSIEPKPGTRALLAYVLDQQASMDGLTADFSKDGSPEKIKATSDRLKLMSQAEQEAIAAKKQAKGNSFLVANFVLAGIDDAKKNYTKAIQLNALVANDGATECGSDLIRRAYEKLVSENTAINHLGAAENWFRAYASKYQPSAYEWDQEGRRRFRAGDFPASANAFEKAATGLDYDYCDATNVQSIQGNTNADAVLSDGRKCVDASVKDTNKYDQRLFKPMLPLVYREMADVLNTRGVYKEALADVKESLALQPNNAFAFDTEAAIFENLEQYPECISAAQAAINASDGKYGFMHFQLGQCYFDTQNWSEAASSYRLAAEQDKSDAAPAFNLGLSLARQGYSADAQRWFREALHRNPDSATRAKILSALQ